MVVLLAPVIARPARADDRDRWLARDKALHASVSFALSAGAYAASAPLVSPRPARAAIGVALALSLGAAKELYDLRGTGTASGRDLAWDAIGALTGAGVAALVDFAWSRLRARRTTEPRPVTGLSFR